MPRSGTTLLSSMLDAHPDIAISPETHFYTRCRPTSANQRIAVQEVWECLQQQPGVADMELSEEEVGRIRSQMQELSDPTPPDLLRAVVRTYADRFGADAWGEKTPDHLAHVPDILQDFPEACVLAIVRDPRDVCLSLEDMPWSRDSLPESAWKWKRYARATEDYRERYPEQFREIRFEDLLDSPESAIGRILDWMDAPFDENVLSFHRRDDGPMDAGREPWKEKVHRPLDPQNTKKWREQMGRGQRALVEWIAGAEMEGKGYDRPAVAVDRELVIDVLRELVRAVRTVGGRLWRRWQAPTPSSDDHTPVWMRHRALFSDEEN